VARFELGSTVVLVVEAPPSLQWTCKPGERIRLGQALVR
jgi:hypothetical protein